MLGFIAGALLGIGVVALTVGGAVPAAAPAVRAPAQSTSNATVSNLTIIQEPSTTSAGPPLDLFGAAVSAGNASGVPSQLSSIPKQPISLTLFAFLPIVAAAVLGLAFYSFSKRRAVKEQSVQSEPI